MKPSDPTQITHCSCNQPVAGLPIDVAYYSDGLKGYVIQHTCPVCRRTLNEAVTGSPKVILIQILAANNLMTDGPDISRRRMLASEAVLRLFRDQEEELVNLYSQLPRI